MSDYLTPVDYDTPAGRVLRNVEDHLADFHEDNPHVMGLILNAAQCDFPVAHRVIAAIRDGWLHEYDRNPFPG